MCLMRSSSASTGVHMAKGKATLIAQSHSAASSSADYLLDPPLGVGYLAVKEVRVSCYLGSMWAGYGVTVIVLPTQRLLRGVRSWEACESVLADLGYDSDPFPLQNNKHLSAEYRESRGWA
jgi:hypothetical protein